MIAFEQAEGGVDWAVLSEIGQAFGVISAMISAIALLGIVRSLYLQRQQTNIAQYQAVRGLGTELLQLALREPRYLAPWGIAVADDTKAAQDRAYHILVFAYFKMAFVVGLLREIELEFTTREAFTHQSVRAFWEHARTIYLADTSNDRAHQFATIVETAYASAVLKESPRDLPPDSRLNHQTE